MIMQFPGVLFHWWSTSILPLNGYLFILRVPFIANGNICVCYYLYIFQIYIHTHIYSCFFFFYKLADTMKYARYKSGQLVCKYGIDKGYINGLTL